MVKSIETVLNLAQSGFRPIEMAKPRHFSAIGKFILSVGTEIDARLKTCLLRQINSGEEALPRAIVGDMRTGEVAGALRRIAELRTLQPEFYENLKRLFAEIENLRRVRNVVVHQTCLVKGNSLAFHNAHDARSDAAMEVNIYSIKELDEFGKYAKLLGFRIVRQFANFSPKRMSPQQEAFLALAAHALFAQTAAALAKGKSLSKLQLEHLKSVLNSSYEAVGAYTKAAREIRPDFKTLTDHAVQTMNESISALEMINAPSGVLLYEVPQRLLSKSAGKQRKGFSGAKKPSKNSR